MRYFRLGAAILGVILVLGAVTPVRAHTELTTAVAAVWGPRILDARLHEIAHARVREITCSGCMNHDRMRRGTAEVLGWNSGYPYPTRQIIRMWASSPSHDGILSNSNLRRIGCARLLYRGKHYFACVLAPRSWP